MIDFRRDCMDAIRLNDEGHIVIYNWVRVFYKDQDFTHLCRVIEKHIVKNAIDWEAVWREYSI